MKKIIRKYEWAVNTFIILTFILFDFLLIGSAKEVFKEDIIATYSLTGIIEIFILILFNFYVDACTEKEKGLRKVHINKIKVWIITLFSLFIILFIMYGFYAVHNNDYFLNFLKM